MPVTLTAKGLSGSHEYQWRSAASENSTFDDISGAAAASYTFPVNKTAWYACSVDGVMTKPIKITALNCVPSVTEAHLAIDSDGQLCVQYTKPANETNIVGYYCSLKDAHGTVSDTRGAYPGTSIPIPSDINLTIGKTYTVSVIAVTNTISKDNSLPVTCAQTFTVTQTTDAAPNIAASQPVLTCVAGKNETLSETIDLTCGNPGDYWLHFYKQAGNAAPFSSCVSAFDEQSAEHSYSYGACEKCTAEKVSIAKQTGGNFVMNCSKTQNITLPAPLKIELSNDDIETDPGTLVTLSVTVTGDKTATSYQWYQSTGGSTQNGTAIAGKTSRTFTVTNNTPGTYFYYCMVDEKYPSICASVRVGTQIGGVTKPVLSVSADGEPSLAYTAATADSNLIASETAFLHNTKDTVSFGDRDLTLTENPISMADLLLNRLDIGTYTLYLRTYPKDETLRPSRADYDGNIIVRDDATTATAADAVTVTERYDSTDNCYVYSFSGTPGYYIYHYTTVSDSEDVSYYIVIDEQGQGRSHCYRDQWKSCSIQKVVFAMVGADMTVNRYAAAPVTITEAVDARLDIDQPAVDPNVVVTLTATVTGAAVSTYSWYSCPDYRGTNGTLITTTTVNTYQLNTTTCGTTYYYYTVTAGDKTYTSNVVELVVGTLLPTAVNPHLDLLDGIPGIVFTAPTEPKNLYYYIYAYNETGKHVGQQYVSQPQYAYLPDYLLISGASGTYHTEIASCSRDPQYRKATVQCPGTFTIIDSNAETPAPTVHSVAITQGSSTVYDYYVTAAKAGTYTICSDRGSCQMLFFSQDGETKSFTEKYQYSTCIARLLTAKEDSGDLTITRAKVSDSVSISSISFSASASAAEANLNTNVTLTANTNLASARYQWYEAKNSYVTTGGTQISEATDKTYEASASSAYTKYYYCVINGIYATNILTVVFGGPLPTAQNCKLGLLGGIPGVIFTAPTDTDHTINYYLITASSTSTQYQDSGIFYNPASAYLPGHAMMSSPAGAYQASVSSAPRSSDTQHRTTTASCPGTITITGSTSVTPALSIVFQAKTTQNSTSYINYVTAPQAGAYVLEVTVSSKNIIYQYLSFASDGETKSFETPQLITACRARRLTAAAAADASGVTNLTITREASAAAVVGTTPVTVSATSDMSGVDVDSSAVLTAAVTGLTGTLSYQWYSNTVNSTSGATPITGADSSSYTVTPHEPGTMYYYCVINGVYVTNILKLDAGTALPPVENPAITVANCVAELTFTAPADSTGIDSYAVNVVYPSGYVETRDTISASSPLNLNSLMFYMQPGVYFIQIVSKPADGSGYRETAKNAGSVTIVNSGVPSPALAISASMIPNDQNNYYSYRCSASPNAGYYQLSYSDGTHDYHSVCTLPMENEFAYEGLMESFTVQCSLASETDGAVTITKYASAAAAVVRFGAAASPSAVASGAEVTLTADTLADAAYQWYSSTNGNTAGGTAILNATGSSYSYTAADDVALESYYYCVATVNGVTYTSNSVTVTITAST